MLSGEREWLLAEGSNLIGRDRDCAIRIDSATLSRHHARIVVLNGDATVEDLDSKNGTQVNGRRASQPVPLEDGDQLQVGSATMVYRTLEALPSTVTRRN